MMSERFKDWKHPKFNKDGQTKWNWICQHHENLELGKNTDIGAFTYINARYVVEIGESTEIGSHCSIYSHSTIDDKQGKVVIGKNVKIGTHSVVMPGVTIGDGAVIGAFSFVNKNVPSGVVAFGVPIKIQ